MRLAYSDLVWDLRPCLGLPLKRVLLIPWHPHLEVPEQEYDQAINEFGRQPGAEKTIAYGQEVLSYKFELVLARHGDECGPKEWCTQAEV